MLVEIDDRIYSDFTVWAKANGMPEEDIQKYVNRAFRDRFMTDKYGDLNEKFAKPTAKPEPETKPYPKLESVQEYAKLPKEEPDKSFEEEQLQKEPLVEEKPKPRKKVLKSN